MPTNTYSCHKCHYENDLNQAFCRRCETPASCAILYSNGKSTLPPDFILPILPTSQTLGSHIHSNILLPFTGISPKVATLHYKSGFIYINPHEPILVNNKKATSQLRLLHGDTLTFGFEEFELVYLNENNRSPKLEKKHLKQWAKDSVSPKVKRQLQLIAFKSSLYECRSKKDIYSLCLDTCLQMTGLERSYGFSVESSKNEMQVNEVIAKKQDFSVIRESEFTISQSIISAVLEKQNSIYISNSDLKVRSKSHSIFEFDIKTIICIPLNTHLPNGEKELIGVIYLDQQHLSHQLTDPLISSLKTAANMTVSALLKVQNQRIELTPQSINQLSLLRDTLIQSRKQLAISAELINKYQKGNPSALKTIIRECRKDLIKAVNFYPSPSILKK